MTGPALAFDHVSKRYRGAQPYGSLRDDLAAGFRRLLGRSSNRRHEVRALDDVSFEIPEGGSFGFIGLNGAGKTTALKLASRITYPTEGEIRVRGRVGALIEVGTGLHPELSGRENVQLYGRILGLSGRQIASRFDEIVAFAELGPAIDQPVKQYSSGMQMRLGFSVAAHLEPDLLLVDEALAVGDAGFQYRCVEKMSSLVREGRTLVFVSHDVAAVESICQRAVLLQQGRIVMEGSARDVIRAYFSRLQVQSFDEIPSDGSPPGDLEIVDVTLHDDMGTQVNTPVSGAPVSVRIRYRAHREVREPIVTIGLRDARLGMFAYASMLVDGHAPPSLAGDGVIECRLETLPLHPQTYELWGEVRGAVGTGLLVDWQRWCRFEVVEPDAASAGKAAVAGVHAAPLKLRYRWDVIAGDPATTATGPREHTGT
jgi:ABC-type polysaccharide/polyol phosphate transport system ATPase subunit